MTTASVTPTPVAAPTITHAAGTDEFGKDDKGAGTLRALLGGSRLAVLAGSGTSHGLCGKAGVAPMMDDLLDLVTKLGSYSDLVSEHPALSAETNVEVLLSKAQAVAALGTSTSDPEVFIAEASASIREACDFIDDSTDLEAHRILLRKLVAQTTGRERLSLFTTNYDLAFEAALRDLHVATIDGFGYGARMKFSGANFGQDLAQRGQRGELQLALQTLFAYSNCMDPSTGTREITEFTVPRLHSIPC